MTLTQQSGIVPAVLLAGALLAPRALPAQDDRPRPGVEVMAYDVAPELLNAREVAQTLGELYPAGLREAGMSGVVVLWLFVDESGGVVKAMVHRAAEQEAFNAAALAVADGMRFRPALMDEVPVGVWMLQKVDFDTR